MARFLSKYAKYEVAVLPPEITMVQGPRGPEEKVVRQGVSAQFEPGGLNDYEARNAEGWLPDLRRGAFSQEDSIVLSDGQAVATEGVRGVTHRIGLYDTDKQAADLDWDDETKTAVEERLRLNPSFGVDFIESIIPKVSAPWPNYSKIAGKEAVEQILARVVEDGYDVNGVLAFEEQNENRAEVVSALRNLAASMVEEEVVA